MPIRKMAVCGVCALLLLSIHAPAQIAPQRLAVAGRSAQRESTLFQVSTLDALLQGIYSSSMTLGELRQHGDFGLGAYEGIDGEMMLVDGVFYQMRFDGTMTQAAADGRASFAAVTTFRPDVQFS